MRYHTIQINGQLVQIELPNPKNFPIDGQGITWDGRKLGMLEPITHAFTDGSFNFWLKIFKDKNNYEDATPDTLSYPPYSPIEPDRCDNHTPTLPERIKAWRGKVMDRFRKKNLLTVH